MHGVRRSKRSTSCGLLAASAACFLCASLLPAPAGAQSEPPPSTPARAPKVLEYWAPPDCPSRDDWLGRVRGRLADTQGRWSVERIAAIPARVTLSATGSEARVVFHDGGVERSIAGADCEEVASAAALIFAVALGAGDSAGSDDSGASPSRVEPSPAPPRLVPPSPGASSLRAAPPPRAASPPRAAPQSGLGSSVSRGAADERIDVPQQSSNDVAPRRWAIGTGAFAEASTWTGPWPAGVFGVAFDAVSPSRGWSARVVGSYGRSESVIDSRRAEFQYWGGHFDLCPIAIGAITAWRWVSCAELHLGLLRGEGDESSALATGSSQRALLATAAATTRIEAAFFGALRLQLETGVALPLLRQTFQFGAPEQVVFESPALGLLARAGVLVPLDGQRD